MEIRYTNGRKYDKNMEKWSAIHHTYKFFKLGTPPRLDKINKSKKLQEQIFLLNRVKNLYLKNKFNPPDLKDVKKNILNKRLMEILNKQLS